MPARWLGAEGEGRQEIGADVKGQHLQDTDRQRERSARERPNDERSQLRDVVRQVVGQEPPDVGEGCPTQADGGHDGLEVVVEQDKVGRLAGDVGARGTHRDTYVCLP